MNSCAQNTIQVNQTQTQTSPIETPIQNAKRILRVVSNVFDIPEGEIIGTRRYREVVLARRACAAILITRMKWSNEMTGSFLHRDRTTVLHMIQRYRLLDDRVFLRKVEEVIRILQLRATVTHPIQHVCAPAVAFEPESVSIPESKIFSAPVVKKQIRDKWQSLIYVEARIPPEWDEAYLRALVREHGTPVADSQPRGEEETNAYKVVGGGSCKEDQGSQ